MKRDFLKNRKFTATVKAKNKIIEGIQGELTIPDEDWEDIIVTFFPTEEELNYLIGEYEIGFTGKPNGDFNLSVNINVIRAFFKETLPFKITRTQKSYIVKYIVADLHEELFSTNNESNNLISGYYNINEVGLLQCSKLLDAKPSGEIKVTVDNVYSIKLNDLVELTFNSIYYYDSEFKSNNKLALLTYSKDVAEFTSIPTFDTVKNELSNVDDLLMLLSFAIRKRCVCTGYLADSGHKLEQFYRRDIYIPEQKSDHDLYKYLVEPAELRNFITYAYNYFKTFSNKDILRRAIFPICNDSNIETESYFLILFSCLESLLLYFKKNERLETIVDAKVFSERKRKIESAIHEIFSDYSDRISLMNKKILELNRPSFESILLKYIDNYSVEIQDVWPLVNSDKGLLLLKIRNRLIHGDSFKNYQLDSLALATAHLKIIVERMILSQLNYPIEKTRVSKKNILSYNSNAEVEKHRLILI